MTSKDYDLNLWERNYAEVPAVQGEAQARTVNIHLKEEVSVTDALGNLSIRQKPVDITGYSAPRLYIDKTDGTKVFFDGTIADAENGDVSFVLPYQATTVAGENTGTVYMTKPDGTTLKAMGLTVSVQASNLDGSIESTDDFSALVTALNEVTTSAATASQAAQNAQQAVTDAGNAISDINAKETEITEAEDARQTNETARQNAEGARNTAEQARATAEAARATAESARQTDTQAAISGANTAASTANTAAGRANTAAQNAEDAIAGQLDPAIDARIAAKVNVTGGLMGYDAARAHIVNSDIHVTAAQKTAWTAKAERSTTATATLAASAWTGTDAPYSITVAVSAAKPEPARIEVQPSPNATNDQWAAWRAALIRGGGQDTGTITLLADGDKPEIDIPITVTVRGDV